MTQPDPHHDWNQGRFRSGLNQMKDYTKGITRETVVYVLLAIGIVIFLFSSLSGGAIIGLVAGWVFADDIVRWLQSLKITMEEESVARRVVLGVTILAFFIAASTIIIGAIAALGLKHIYFTLAKK